MHTSVIRLLALLLCCSDRFGRFLAVAASPLCLLGRFASLQLTPTCQTMARYWMAEVQWTWCTGWVISASCFPNSHEKHSPR
jgi:hypothetical protein